MSDIKQAHLDLIAKISSIGTKYFKYVNIWDDQVAESILGDTYSFQTPSVFIEFIPGESKMLGAGVSSYPTCLVCCRIVSMSLNKDKFMERNLDVMDNRDELKSPLLGYSPHNCSGLQMYEDVEDFKHKNIYVWKMTFNTNFIDFTGSIFDPRKSSTGLIDTVQIDLEETPYITETGDQTYEYNYENE